VRLEIGHWNVKGAQALNLALRVAVEPHQHQIRFERCNTLQIQLLVATDARHLQRRRREIAVLHRTDQPVATAGLVKHLGQTGRQRENALRRGFQRDGVPGVVFHRDRGGVGDARA
jgi:hypothetical protein